MMAIDSQPFSIMEDMSFLRLMANVCPKYTMPSRRKDNTRRDSTIRAKLLKDIHLMMANFQ